MALRIQPWSLVLALSLGVFACDEGSDPTSSPDDSLRAAKIGMSEAIAAAERELAGGVPVEGEFELGRDGAVFEVEILVDGEVHEVLIDPSDGRVLGVELDPEDLAEAIATAARLADARLSLAEAIAIAERETSGTVFEIEVGDEGFELAVLTDAGPLELILSTSDGAVLSNEAAAAGPENELDDDEEDDEEDDD